MKKGFIYIFLTIFLLQSSFAKDDQLFERNLNFLNFKDLRTGKITLGDKVFENQKDRVFKDQWGREFYFKGWNIANVSKGETYGYKPFKDVAMAQENLNKFFEATGSNIIRWLFSWEGTHPDVDQYNLQYIDDQLEQIKIAIHKGAYILIDFHHDTFSRHVKGGSNSAPKWVVDGMNLTTKECPSLLQKLCDSNWSVNYVLNKGVIMALEKFWSNQEIDTKLGKRKVLNEYERMLEKVLVRIKEKLTPEEFTYIIGLDAYNEPHYGGPASKIKARKWLNNSLWPFYQRVRLSIRPERVN